MRPDRPDEGRAEVFLLSSYIRFSIVPTHVGVNRSVG